MPRVKYTKRDPKGIFTSDEEQGPSEDEWMEHSDDDQESYAYYSIPGINPNGKSFVGGRFASKNRVKLPFLPVSANSTEGLKEAKETIQSEENKMNAISIEYTDLFDLADFGLSPPPVAPVIPFQTTIDDSFAPNTIKETTNNKATFPFLQCEKNEKKINWDWLLRVEQQRLDKFLAEEEAKKKKHEFGIGGQRAKLGKINKRSLPGSGGGFGNNTHFNKQARGEEGNTNKCSLNYRIQQHATVCASRAFSCFSSASLTPSQLEQRVAASIRKEFDQEFGPKWKCIVGPNFYSNLSYNVEHMFYFRANNTPILLYK